MIVETVILAVVSLVCVAAVIGVAVAAYFGYGIFTFTPASPSGNQYYSPQGIVSGNVKQAPLAPDVATRESQTIAAILAANKTTSPINNPIA